MRCTRQPVATEGNGFALFLAMQRAVDLPLIATGCNHGLHKGSILRCLLWLRRVTFALAVRTRTELKPVYFGIRGGGAPTRRGSISGSSFAGRTRSCGRRATAAFEDFGSATLTVKLLVYGYSAFTPDRYPVGSRITGIGLIAPAF
jgi:hypothetical protein